MHTEKKRLYSACPIAVIVILLLALTPASFAEARVHSQLNSRLKESIERERLEEAASVQPGGQATPMDFNRQITDEGTGISASVSMLDEFVSESGECYFSVEVLFDDGETQIIRPYVSIKEAGDEISLRIPIDSNHIGYTPKVYICEEVEQEASFTATSDAISVTAPNQASIKITYEAPDDATQVDDENTSESSSTKINTVIPEDDDEGEAENPDDEDNTCYKKVAVLITVLAIIGIILWIGVVLWGSLVETVGKEEALETLAKAPKALAKFIKTELESKN